MVETMQLSDRIDALKYSVKDYIRSAPSRRLFHSQRFALSGPQRAAVTDLRRRGIAFVGFDELFAEAPLWDHLERSFRQFLDSNEVQEAIAGYRSGAGRKGKVDHKEYLVRQFPLGDEPTISLDDPWLRLALDERVLNVVNTYLGRWAKLYYVDLWCALPSTAADTPVASQRWHRDREDRKIVKVFFYLADVSEGAGPLQYIPGSRHSGGRYSHLWPRDSYPPDGALEARIPAEEWVTCTAPSRTLVFTDTTGFHRGGLCHQEQRLCATWTYVTTTTTRKRRFHVGGDIEGSDLADVQKFAIS